jgi:hypothetical protein
MAAQSEKCNALDLVRLTPAARDRASLLRKGSFAKGVGQTRKGITHAKRVTDEMFVAAAHAVAEEVTQAELDIGLIYPPQSTIMKTELRAAQRVAELISHGLARVPVPKDIVAFVESQSYKAEISRWSDQSALRS